MNCDSMQIEPEDQIDIVVKDRGDVVALRGDELCLWHDYITHSSGSREKTSALTGLLEAHDHMLKAVAMKQCTRPGVGKVGDFEDFCQEAKIAAIMAYETYKPQSSAPTDQQFRNYIYGRVLGALRTFGSRGGLITCPSQIVSWRNWLNGVYDAFPEKKALFEITNGLLDDASKEEARKTYSALASVSLEADFTGFDGVDVLESMQPETGDFSDEVAARVDMERALDEAVKNDCKPARSKAIFKLMCEHGMSVQEVVNVLGVSRAVARESIHETRVKLRRVLAEMAESI